MQVKFVELDKSVVERLICQECFAEDLNTFALLNHWKYIIGEWEVNRPDLVEKKQVMLERVNQMQRKERVIIPFNVIPVALPRGGAPCFDYNYIKPGLAVGLDYLLGEEKEPATMQEKITLLQARTEEIIESEDFSRIKLEDIEIDFLDG